MEILSGHTELSIVSQMFVIEGCLQLWGIHHTHCGVLVLLCILMKEMHMMQMAVALVCVLYRALVVHEIATPLHPKH